MADKKISQLTQLTSANAITDVLPIVDSSLNQTNKITAAKFPMSASAIARSYPYTRDFISGTERTRDLTTITNSSAYNYIAGLTSIYIGSKVTYIGAQAFMGCSGLTSITIPSSVTAIGSAAFRLCTGLTSITIPDSVTSIGSYAFALTTSLSSITIPDSVTEIGSDAFKYSTITSITLPTNDNFTLISSAAFSYSSLTSITIPDNVTTIGSRAFFNTNLTSITIPDSVTSIGSRAFYGTSLSTVNSLATNAPTLVGQNPFLNFGSVTKITVPRGAKASYQTAGNGTTYGGLEIEEA